jgi:hypothetical protein
MPVAEKKFYGYPVKPTAEKKPYSYVPSEEPVDLDTPDEPAFARRPGAPKLDATTMDTRVLVLLASCMLAKLLDRSGFKYVPSLRRTQIRTTLVQLPVLLSRMQTLQKDVSHELAKAMRIGPRQYLKQATRELAVLFAEE